MGRAFEFRKARKFKRWGNMARVFTRIGKEIDIAVKAGGPDPSNNPHLRLLIQNAKSENMPKENVERAIKRAVSKDTTNYKEVIYEGYGPYGVAMLIETATDNNTRTVANVRSYFTKAGGSLGTQGCLTFLFDRKSVFKIALASIGDQDIEEFELELIDCDVDEIFVEEEEIVIYGPFEAYGKIQSFLDAKGLEIISGGFERIPTNELKALDAEQTAVIEKLIDKFEDDDDVVNVFHNAQLQDSEAE
ncbi:MAG: YebC/PmpR family DNA-binding transcriptional regulator [Mucinivorans sp.]